MDGYAPGEQPSPGERVVKLNTNENPFPPSPKVMQAIPGSRAGAGGSLRAVSESDGRFVFAAAAAGKLLGDRAANMIMAGNGSDDVLAVAMSTFLSAGDVLAYPNPTYSLYPVLAELDDVKVCGRVPWERDLHACRSMALLAKKPASDFPGESECAIGHVRVAAEDVAKLAKEIQRAAARIDEDVCRISGMIIASAIAEGSRQRGDLADAEQGVFAGGAAVWICGGAAAGDRRDDEGEGQLQLRRDLRGRRDGRD